MAADGVVKKLSAFSVFVKRRLPDYVNEGEAQLENQNRFAIALRDIGLAWRRLPHDSQLKTVSFTLFLTFSVFRSFLARFRLSYLLSLIPVRCSWQAESCPNRNFNFTFIIVLISA